MAKLAVNTVGILFRVALNLRSGQARVAKFHGSGQFVRDLCVLRS